MLRHWVEWTRSDVLPFYFYSVGCSTALWNIMFLGVTSIHAVTTKFHIESEEIAPDNQQFFLLRSRLTLYNTFKASRTQCISGGCRCRGLNTFQFFSSTPTCRIQCQLHVAQWRYCAWPAGAGFQPDGVTCAKVGWNLIQVRRPHHVTQ